MTVHILHMICENCQIMHDGLYGSGRFCSQKCARCFSTKNKRVEINTKVSEKLKSQLKNYEHICQSCSITWLTKTKRRNVETTLCKTCTAKSAWQKTQAKGRRKNWKSIPIDDLHTIMQCSSRTISKILSRSGCKCSLCGWDKTALDVHHIIPHAQGGSHEHDNLIIVCPNCHRLAHEGKVQINQLQEQCIQNTLTNWKEFYNTI